VRRLAAVGTAGALWVALAASAGAAPADTTAAARHPGVIGESPLGAGTQIYLFGLASGPDDDLWFAQLGCMGLGHCSVGRVSTDGRITDFRHGLNPGSIPFAITTGRDGNMWFTDAGPRPAIGRITPRGRITEFSRGLARGSVPFEIALGPDGNVWFTDQGARPAVGRITPSGRITEFSHGLRSGSVPFGIAAGARQTVWFTDRGCSGAGRCAIGRISPAGRIEEFTAGLRHGGQPLGVAGGAGGDAWFADSAGAIGQVTPAGRITERTRGLKTGSSPVAITAGQDGAMWFTDEGSTAAVGRITPRGRIREFSAGLLAGSQPAFIAAAPDGRLWFSDEGSAAALGSVTTGVPAALRAAPRLTGGPQVGATIGCAPARWATWAGAPPSVRLLPFDGYRWLRDGTLIPGQRGAAYTPVAADAGQRLACRETVTYKAPLNVTASATSAPRPVRSPR
jgi:virginiamycin B lyase